MNDLSDKVQYLPRYIPTILQYWACRELHIDGDWGLGYITLSYFVEHGTHTGTVLVLAQVRCTVQEIKTMTMTMSVRSKLSHDSSSRQDRIRSDQILVNRTCRKSLCRPFSSGTDYGIVTCKASASAEAPCSATLHPTLCFIASNPLLLKQSFL